MSKCQNCKNPTLSFIVDKSKPSEKVITVNTTGKSCIFMYPLEETTLCYYCSKKQKGFFEFEKTSDKILLEVDLIFLPLYKRWKKEEIKKKKSKTRSNKLKEVNTQWNQITNKVVSRKNLKIIEF